MAATSESAPSESFANISLNEEGEKWETEAFEDGLDDIEMNGIPMEQVSLYAGVIRWRIKAQIRERFIQGLSKQLALQIGGFNSRQRSKSGGY